MSLPRVPARRPPATRLSLYLVLLVGLTAVALIAGDGGAGDAAAGSVPDRPVTREQLRGCLVARGIPAALRGTDEVVAPVGGAAIVLRAHPSEAAALAAVGGRTVALPGSGVHLSPVDNNVTWRPAGGLPVGAYARMSACFDAPPAGAWQAPAARLD